MFIFNTFSKKQQETFGTIEGAHSPVPFHRSQQREQHEGIGDWMPTKDTLHSAQHTCTPANLGVKTSTKRCYIHVFTRALVRKHVYYPFVHILTRKMFDRGRVCMRTARGALGL